MEKLDVIYYPSEPYGIKYEDIKIPLIEAGKDYPKMIEELAYFISSVYAMHIKQSQSIFLLRFVDDLPVCTIWGAIMRHISNNSCPPTPADIRHFAKRQMEIKEFTEGAVMDRNRQMN
jgi:hypothetical protein